MRTPEATDEGEVFPENVSPIRSEMMFVFDANTPIVNSVVQERIDCRRYEAGVCRDCDAPRGSYSPWCRTHYPWTPEEWAERMDSGR